MLLFGHRRRAAAIEAGLATVPCDVRADYAGKSAEQIADMLAENLHRRDLTGLEEAAGYEQLSMFDGWTPERIAGRIGRPVEQIRAGLAAAKVSAELRPKVVDGGADVGAGRGDRGLRRRPQGLPAAGPGRELPARAAPRSGRRAAPPRGRRPQGGHPARAGRRRRADHRQAEELPLVLGRSPGHRAHHADGELLTVEAHASCPGHAAFIDDTGEAVFVCQHPKDWNHGTPAVATGTAVRPRSAPPRKPPRPAGAGAKRWPSPTRPGLSFLHEYLSRKGRPPAGTLRTALEILASRDPTTAPPGPRPGTCSTRTPTAGTAAAVFVEAVAKTADNRLPLLALAYAAAAAEANMRSRQASWQFDPELAVRWLTILEGLGYPLSEVEASCGPTGPPRWRTRSTCSTATSLTADSTTRRPTTDCADGTGPPGGPPARGPTRRRAKEVRDEHATTAAARRPGRRRPGWPVFPLIPGGKRPAITGWQHHATVDADILAVWWRGVPYNVGIACGPAALLVVDLDGPHGRKHIRWPGRGPRACDDVHRRHAVRRRTPLLHRRVGRPAPSTVARLGAGRYPWRRRLRRRSRLGPAYPRPASVLPCRRRPSAAARRMDHTTTAGANTRVAADPRSSPQHLRAGRSRRGVRTGPPGPAGTRNAVLFQAAVRLGTLVGAGLLDQQQVQGQLLAVSTVHLEPPGSRGGGGASDRERAPVRACPSPTGSLRPVRSPGGLMSAGRPKVSRPGRGERR